MTGHVARDSETESYPSVDRHEKNRRSHEKDLQVIWPVHDHFREGLDCKTYRLANKLSSYDGEVAQSVARLAKHLQVQMQPPKCSVFNLISTISFLSAFKLVCDTGGVRKEAAL